MAMLFRTCSSSGCCCAWLSSLQLKYFDDPVVRCMQAMDCVESREMADKCEFFAVLPQAVPQFPKVRRARILHPPCTDSTYENGSHQFSQRNRAMLILLRLRGVRRWIQLLLDFDSKAVRPSFDCLSKVIKVTMT